MDIDTPYVKNLDSPSLSPQGPPWVLEVLAITTIVFKPQVKYILLVWNQPKSLYRENYCSYKYPLRNKHGSPYAKEKGYDEMYFIHHRSGKSNHNYVIENKDNITLSRDWLSICCQTTIP